MGVNLRVDLNGKGWVSRGRCETGRQPRPHVAPRMAVKRNGKQWRVTITFVLKGKVLFMYKIIFVRMSIQARVIDSCLQGRSQVAWGQQGGGDLVPFEF
jgi:hypothetical protein